jgi:hypothetical protein
MACCKKCANPITKARLRREALARGSTHVGGGLVSPAEVQARATLIDGQWSSLAVDAANCGAMDPNTPDGSAFNTDLAAWKIFFQKNHDAFWTAGSVMSELDDWQTALSNWQAKLRGFGCKQSGIVVKPAETTSTTASIEGTVKWAALGAAAIAAALLIGKV